jgi:hypothetical protein
MNMFLSVVEIVDVKLRGGAQVPTYGKRLINVKRIVDIQDAEPVTDSSRSDDFTNPFTFNTTNIRLSAAESMEPEFCRVEGSLEMFSNALHKLGVTIVHVTAENDLNGSIQEVAESTSEAGEG